MKLTTSRSRGLLLLSVALGVGAMRCSPPPVSQPDVADNDSASPQDTGVIEDTGVPMDVASQPDASAPDSSVSAPFTVRNSAGATDVPNGSTQSPTQLDGVPGYSSGVHSFTIVAGAAPVTITSITLEPIAPTRSDEWTLNTSGSTSRSPITVSNQMIPAMMTFSFGVYFSPRASGQRDMRVRIAYGSGSEFAFTVRGRGRDNLVISPNVGIAMERTYGRRTQTSLIGAAVADSAGNVYFSQNVTQWSDNFSNNIAIARMNADGTLGWQREWNEQYMQRQPDPGQNAESGGGSNSVHMGPDGSLFFVGNRSQATTNNTFQGLVARVDPANGNMLWARGILRSANAVPTLANQGVEAYAVSATLSDRVIVAGSANNGGVLLAALSKTDGSLLWGRQLQLTMNGTASRAHSLVVDSAGNGYLGGFAGDASSAVLVKVTGLNTASPSFAWAKTVGIGVGGNINGLALDEAGGVVASLDYRGATTMLGVARFSATGALTWGRIWDLMNAGDNNNTYSVTVAGASVYVGGRVSISPYDTQAGEGFMMRLGLADAAWQWGAFYYSGKTVTTIMEHRVKSILATSSGLVVLAQGYPGPQNESAYSGLWYQTTDEANMFPSGTGSMRLADSVAGGRLMVSDRPARTLDPLVFMETASISHPGTAHVINTTSIWGSPPADVTFVPPEMRMGNNGRGMAVIQRLDVR